MLLRILRPLSVLRRRFVVRGLMEGNRKWLILGGAAWALHLARRMLIGGDPLPVYTEELEPGQRLMITHTSRPQKRRR